MKNFFINSIPVCLILCSSLVYGQWSTNAGVNTPVCTGNLDRYSKQIISDGKGGLFVCWYEDGTNSTYSVNAQYLNKDGNQQWGANGIAVYNGPDGVEAPQLVLDGSGGIIIAWKDDDSSNVYGQHLTSTGTKEWAESGINISGDVNGIATYEPQMLSDGAGGAIIVWDGPFAVVAARVTSSGSIQWKKTVTQAQGGTDTRIASDGAGGVILVWTDSRNAGTGDIADLYSQRLSATGTAQWSAGGVPVSTAPNLQSYPHIVPDGSNGAVIVWEDFRDGANYKPYGQRLDANGHRLWVTGTDSNGVSICSVVDALGDVTVTPDGSGGGIFAWDDSRTNDDDIYAQRINAAGKVQWDTNSVPICVQSAPQANPRICSDGSGGAIVIWDDNRNSGINQDIYAQRINSSGAVQWTANGIAVSSATHNQNVPLIAANPSGGAVAVWDDYRNGGSGNTHPDYYVQTIDLQGTLTEIQVNDLQVPQQFELSQNYPNPFNPTTTIDFTISAKGYTTLIVLNMLGQKVATLFEGTIGGGQRHQVTFDGSHLSSGAYVARLQSGGQVQARKMVLIK